MFLIDVSSHNIGEAELKNGKWVIKAYHDFDWAKARAQNVDGAIIKASQGLAKDPGFDILSRSCDLPHKTGFHFLTWTRYQYTMGEEVKFGQQQAQKFLEITSKWDHDLIEGYDLERNACWETLDNTKASNYAIARAMKINLAAVMEHHRLTGYWPLEYTNKGLTFYMQNFIMCPLWIASPYPNVLSYYHWKTHAIRQISWTADGRLYGNYQGNPSVDVNLLNVPIETLYRKPGAVVTPPPVVTPPIVVPVPSPQPSPVPSEGVEPVFAGSRSVPIGIVNADGYLTVRSAPKKVTGNEIGRIPNGQSVDILAIIEDGQNRWARVGIGQFAAIRYNGVEYIK